MNIKISPAPKRASKLTIEESRLTIKVTLSQSIIKQLNEIRTANQAKYMEYMSNKKMTNAPTIDSTSNNCDKYPKEWHTHGNRR